VTEILEWTIRNSIGDIENSISTMSRFREPIRKRLVAFDRNRVSLPVYEGE